MTTKMEATVNTENMTPIEIALRMDKDGFVSAKNLYEFLEMDKSNYARWCRMSITENPFCEINLDFIPFVMNDERNPNPTTDYKLTASFAKKLAMQSGSMKGEEARSYFVACEQALVQIAKERHQWEIERAKGVMIRHILTDTIKLKIADSPNKRFAYPNYTKMIYKAVFGKSMAELQEQFGVKPRESIREYLTAEQLSEVQSVEMLVSSLINIGMGYDEIKAFVNDRYTAKLVA